MLEQLPVSLVGLAARVVHTTPETPNVVAWGDPAVILSCGAARPASLRADSGAQFFSATGTSGPFFDVTTGGGKATGGTANVYTTVDRAAYVSITIPKTYNAKPLPTLARAIAKALPPVCSTEPTSPAKDRCTRRP